MRYKLIHCTTNQDTICGKASVGGYDYYIINDFIEEGDFAINLSTREVRQYDGIEGMDCYWKKVIATNNPSIDIPKIVNEVMVMATKLASEYSSDSKRASDCCLGIMAGHNKSQETHPFSEDDMVEFGEYLSVQQDEDGQILNPNYVKDRVLYISAKQLLEIWKSQRIKTLYYL